MNFFWVKCRSLDGDKTTLWDFRLLCHLQRLNWFLAYFRTQRPTWTHMPSNPLWYCASYGVRAAEFQLLSIRGARDWKVECSRTGKKERFEKVVKIKWHSFSLSSSLHALTDFAFLSTFPLTFFFPFPLFISLCIYWGGKKVHSHFYENVDWGWSPSVQTVWNCDFLSACFSVREKTSLLR